jgi:hypothetical protein
MRRAGAPLMAMAGSVVAAGCVPDRNFAPLVEECREAIPRVLYEHACQHGRLGPYERAAAAPEASLLAAPVSARQRTLEISMPGLDSNDDELAYLQYIPSRDGQHAVFSGAGRLPVSISATRDGMALPKVALELVREVGSCGGMVEVTGFELVAGATYVFEIGPTEAREVTMFIEHLGSFGAQWSEQCRR